MNMIYQNNSSENNCCERQERRRSCCCSVPGTAICFLVLLVFVAVALMAGAVLYETILPVIPAIIAFAAALLAVIVALLIYRWVRRCD